jgi:hypothetical protein
MQALKLGFARRVLIQMRRRRNAVGEAGRNWGWTNPSGN